MASPIRLRLLAMLNEGVATPKDLAARLGQPLENVSYHIRVLRDLGCIELVKTEQRRGATAHFYRAKGRAFLDAAGTASLEEAERAAMSATILQDVFSIAFEATAEGTFDKRPDRHLSYTHLELTEDDWAEVNRRLHDLIEDALGMHARALASDETTIVSDLVMMHFPSSRKP